MFSLLHLLGYHLRVSQGLPGWLLMLGLLAGRPAQAQSPDRVLDSLRQVLRQHPADSAGARALAMLSEPQLSASPDSAAYYARLAIVAARPYPRLLATAYLRLGVARYYQNHLPQARQAYDSAYALARTQHNARQMGEALRRNGNAALEQTDYAQALAYYRRAAQVHQAAGQPVERGMALGNIGFLYKQIGDYDRALGEFFQELRVMEPAAQDPRLSAAERKTAASAVCAVLSYLGETYNRTQNWPEARRYLTRLLALQQQAHDQEGLANTLNNLANTNAASGQPAVAERQLRQAVAIQLARHDPLAISTSRSNLAEILMRRRTYAEAGREYQAAVALVLPLHNARQAHHALLGLAGAQLAQRQTVAARVSLDSAWHYVRQLATKQAYATFYQVQGDYYEQAGQPQLALRSFRQHVLYKDSLLNADKAKVIADLGIKYETEQKEAANRLQAAQLRTQQQVIRRRNVQLGAGLAVVALLAGLTYLLYNRRRLRQQVAFAQERRALEHQRVAAVLEAEEQERQRIGADLHDGVGQVLSAARLNLNALGRLLPMPPVAGTESPQALLANTLSMLETSFQEVRDISHNLVPNALLRRGLATAVREFLGKMTSATGLRVEVEVFGLDQERLPATTESVLFRIVQELVQNITKHAHASELTLQLIRTHDSLTIMVEDNGVGFDVARATAQGGLGLRNIQTRLAYLGGTADFDSTPGHGTTVTLEVPVAPSATARQAQPTG